MSAVDDLPPLREVIRRHGLNAKKALGQNFLLDLNLTARIARAAGPLDGIDVVEIGPGPGGLTRALLAQGAPIDGFGALPGLFPIDAAAAALSGREPARAASDDALQAAAGLMDKSLLLRAETSVVATCPLYYMLDTVRAYAAQELAASGGLDVTRARHEEWFAGLWRDAQLSDELVEHVGRT